MLFYNAVIIDICLRMSGSHAEEPTAHNKTMIRMGSNGFPNNTLLLL